MSSASSGALVRRAPIAPRICATALALLLPVALYWGFVSRRERDLLPDDGLGYGLGVAGLAMMTALLGYSLRKRWSATRGWGPLRLWFRTHMVLGLLGPAAVLFHCNFQLGSLNSSVALACVAIVSSSGVIGRFLYLRVQRGPQLEGIRTLRGNALCWVGSPTRLGTCEPLATLLDDFERRSTQPRREFLGELRRYLASGHDRRAVARACRAALPPSQSPAERRALERELRPALAAIRRAGRFGFYAWLLSLWHALHLPLCFLLFGSAAVHVWAVHAY